MLRYSYALILLLLPSLWVSGQDVKNDKAEALLPQVLRSNSIVFAKIPMDCLESKNGTSELAKVMSKSKWFETFRDNIAEIRTAIDTSEFYVVVDIPYLPDSPLVRFYAVKGPKFQLAGLQKTFDRLGLGTAKVEGELVFLPNWLPIQPRSNEPILGPPMDEKQLVKARLAIAQVRDYPIQIAVVPPVSVWRALNELMPEIPEGFGGGATSILTEGVQWAAIGGDANNLKLYAMAQSSNEQAAKKLAEHFPVALGRFKLPIGEVEQGIIRGLVSQIKPLVEKDRASVSLSGGNSMIGTLLVSALQQATAMVESESQRKAMRQLLLGALNYESVYKKLPANITNKDGKKLLSWRVALLPFLGEVELYNLFAKDESWDSPHNRQLLERIPSVYRSYTPGLFSSKDLTVGHTTFLAPQGEGTVLGDARNVLLEEIIDGLSNTVIVVRGNQDRAVPWTAPDDYPIDNGVEGLAKTGNGIMVGLCDGSIFTITKKLTKEEWKNLFLRNDGKAISLSSQP